jgi:hypothetical protein
MTCLEKLKEKCPDYDSAMAYILENCCPDDFGIMDDPDNCDPFTEACDKCWARVIPGSEQKNEWPKENPHISASAKEAIKKVAEAAMRAAKSASIVTTAIKDSGDRTQFESGAVRDMREGKGRCDLMPLEVVARWLRDDVLRCVAQFKAQGAIEFLYGALTYFVATAYPDTHTSKIEACLEVAKHFEEGAKKYGENNWQKGMPVHCYIDSAVRHYLKWLRGDKDEPHDRAFVWNIMCCIWEVDYREKGETEVKDPTVKVAYICDGEKCKGSCSPECNHTFDISHAKNFERVNDRLYREKEETDETD